VNASLRHGLQYAHPQVSRVRSCLGLVGERQTGHSMAWDLDFLEVGRGVVGLEGEEPVGFVGRFLLRGLVVTGLDGAIAVV